MSSPIAIERAGAPSNLHVSAHGALSRERRVGVLAERIALHIESLVPRGRACCLGIGAGDVAIAIAAAVHALMSRTDWRSCSFDGHTIPHGDAEFDVTLVCDVLHRAPEEAARLLAEARRVAHHVLVQERFGAGGAARCFTRDGFVQLVGEQRLRLTALDCGLDLDEQLPAAELPLDPGRPFIAVLQRR